MIKSVYFAKENVYYDKYCIVTIVSRCISYLNCIAAALIDKYVLADQHSLRFQHGWFEIVIFRH